MSEIRYLEFNMWPEWKGEMVEYLAMWNNLWYETKTELQWNEKITFNLTRKIKGSIVESL